MEGELKKGEAGVTWKFLETYPLDPFPLLFPKGRGSVGKRGAKPLSKISSPSPLKERGI